MAGELGLPDEQVGFVMRIWLEEGNGASFWRGSVKEIESSLVSHFQDGSALLPVRERTLGGPQWHRAGSPPSGRPEPMSAVLHG
jgi:hypothetical protein